MVFESEAAEIQHMFSALPFHYIALLRERNQTVRQGRCITAAKTRLRNVSCDGFLGTIPSHVLSKEFVF